MLSATYNNFIITKLVELPNCNRYVKRWNTKLRPLTDLGDQQDTKDLGRPRMLSGLQSAV